MEGLLDTKKEYTNHLVDILIIPISKKIYSLYEECIKEKKNLVDFQKKLNNVKNWNNNIIKEEYENIKKKTNCNYMPKLLKTIFITSIKIKIYNYNNKKITLKSPSIEDFIHKCYINCCIFSWKNTYLFWNQGLKSSEKQYHLNLIEKNFKKIIKNTIRDIIPIEEILEQINNEDEHIDNKNINQDENEYEDKEEVNEDEDDEEEANEDEDDEEEANEDEDDEEEANEDDEEEANEDEEEADKDDDDEENDEEEDNKEKADEEDNKEEVYEKYIDKDDNKNEEEDNKEEVNEKYIDKDDEEFNDLKNIDLSSVESDNSDSDSIQEDDVIETKKINFQKTSKNAFF